MSKIRLAFYRAILVLLAMIYFLTIDALYADIGGDRSEEGLVPSLIAMIIIPIILTFALIRLWVLKGVKKNRQLLDLGHFLIAILVAICCFAIWNWAAISLSVLAEFLIAYEFTRRIGATKPGSSNADH